MERISIFYVIWEVIVALVVVSTVQRSAKEFVRGCEKFVIALDYLFCLALVGSCLARFAYFLAYLVTWTSY